MSGDPKTFTFEELRAALTDRLALAEGCRSRVNPSMLQAHAIQILYQAIAKRTGEVVTTRDRLMARNILRECAGSELQAAAASAGLVDLVPGGWR